MAKKRKPAPFRADKAVKAAAREQIGMPPPTRAVPEKNKETREKHRRTLSDLLREE